MSNVNLFVIHRKKRRMIHLICFIPHSRPFGPGLRPAKYGSRELSARQPPCTVSRTLILLILCDELLSSVLKQETDSAGILPGRDFAGIVTLRCFLPPDVFHGGSRMDHFLTLKVIVY